VIRLSYHECPSGALVASPRRFSVITITPHVDFPHQLVRRVCTSGGGACRLVMVLNRAYSVCMALMELGIHSTHRTNAVYLKGSVRSRLTCECLQCMPAGASTRTQYILMGRLYSCLSSYLYLQHNCWISRSERTTEHSFSHLGLI